MTAHKTTAHVWYRAWLLTLPLFLNACTNTPKDGPVMLSVKGLAAEVIVLTSYDAFMTRTVLATDTLDASGVGRISVSLPASQMAYYEIGENRKRGQIFLSPGDEITLDAVDKIVFTGRGSAINSYLSVMQGTLNKILYGNPPFFHKDPDEFRHWYDSVVQVTEARYHYLTDSLKIDEANRAWLKDKLALSMTLACQDYLWANPLADTIEEIYSAATRLTGDSTLAALQLADFSQGARQYFQTRFVPRQWDYSDNRLPGLLFDTIEAASLGRHSRQLMHMQNIGYCLPTWGLTSAMEEVLTRFQQTYPDCVYQPRINAEVNKFISLKPGQAAPEFRGQTREGTVYSSIDLKGKVVFVDVWASWCGPCRQELPVLQSIAKKFNGRNDILFVQYSIDQKREDWEEASRDIKHGLNLLGDSSIYRKYQLHGVPRYILIDKEGKLANAFAPKPSSGKLMEEIVAALER